MITIDITMVIQIINILIMIAVMNAILYKPVRTVLRKREEQLKSLEKAIETFDKNTKLRQDEIERKLREARSKAKATIEDAKGKAMAESTEKLTGVRTEVTTAKLQQLADIEKQVAAARDELRGQIDGFATEMAVKILGRSI